MSSNGTAGFYRLYAARCIEISRQLAGVHGRAVLLNMAQAWIALADQAEKNDGTTLVYETPQPHPHAVEGQSELQTFDKASGANAAKPRP